MTEMTSLDQSGEQAVPPSQGSAGSASHCLVRDARARMTEAEFWENVFLYREGPWFLVYSADPLDYYDPNDEDLSDVSAEQGLPRPCTECGELICGTDMMGRPMFHRQTEEDD